MLFGFETRFGIMSKEVSCLFVLFSNLLFGFLRTGCALRVVELVLYTKEIRFSPQCFRKKVGKPENRA